MKKCKECNIIKNLESFYKHNGMKDGHINICIDCKKSYSVLKYSEYSKDENWMQKERERALEKHLRLNYNKKYVLKNKKKYPEKTLARNASCKIKKKYLNTHNHHWSYNQEDWRDVIELSISDHNELHKKMNYDSKLRLYRKLNGDILLTKQSHLDLLSEI